MNRRQFLQTLLDNVDPNSYDKDLVALSEPEYGLIEDVLNVLEPFKVRVVRALSPFYIHLDSVATCVLENFLMSVCPMNLKQESSKMLPNHTTMLGMSLE